MIYILAYYYTWWFGVLFFPVVLCIKYIILSSLTSNNDCIKIYNVTNGDIYRLKKSRIRVIFGDHDQSTTNDGETITRMVSSIVRHRNFDVNSYNHDVALLRLRKAVPFTKSVRPICLPIASKYIPTVFNSIKPSGVQRNHCQRYNYKLWKFLLQILHAISPATYPGTLTNHIDFFRSLTF